ncbi:sterol regulatory element-binding protein 2-like isoform X2 [Sycon ciliatum]|uniref:sterol regulatory element-binding protein 2-like isoform X2 n=1 Tax=Sycon ciliatum TaxID=27933 RepID=UPI0031F60882
MEQQPRNARVTQPQPSELDKLVTVATLLAQGSQDAASSSGASSGGHGGHVQSSDSSTYAHGVDLGTLSSSGILSNEGQSSPLIQGTASCSQAGGGQSTMAMASSTGSSNQLSVQDPAAYNTLQSLLSQLQHRQTMEQSSQQHQSQQIQQQQQLQQLQQQQQQQQLQPQQQLQQLAQQIHQHRPLTLQAAPAAMPRVATNQLPFPLLHMAAPPVAASSATSVPPAILAPLVSVASGGAPLSLNPYAGHPLGAAFPPNMALLQPIAQPATAMQPFIQAAQPLGNDLIIKLEKLASQPASNTETVAPVAIASNPPPLQPLQIPQLTPSASTVKSALTQPPARRPSTPVSMASVAEATEQEPTAASAQQEVEPARLPSRSKPGPAKLSRSAAACASSLTAAEKISKRRKGKTKRNPSHNVIEARYRLSINDKIKELRKRVAGKDTKIQKSGVLQLTLERLKAVDDENDTLRQENASLRNAHEAIVGQIHAMSSQLQAKGIPMDASMMEVCHVPELQLNRASSTVAVSHCSPHRNVTGTSTSRRTIKSEGSDVDVEEDDDDEEEDDDDDDDDDDGDDEGGESDG